MRFFGHAAGYAAAMVALVGGLLFANPSRAWEADVPPVTSVADHSQNVLDSTDEALNLDVPQADAGVPPVAAVVVHAKAALDGDEEMVPSPSLSDLVNDLASSETGGAEEDCLAGAVYFEAKGESLKGQLTVAEVVLNRSRSGRFPSSICGVVKQRGQFSFIRGGQFPAIPRTSAAWRKAVAIAQIALRDLADGSAPEALFFHATHVSPRWRGLTRVATVGNHVFYR